MKGRPGAAPHEGCATTWLLPALAVLTIASGCSLLVERRLAEGEADGGRGEDSGHAMPDASQARCPFPSLPIGQHEACWHCACGRCPQLTQCLGNSACSEALACLPPPALFAAYWSSCSVARQDALRDEGLMNCPGWSMAGESIQNRALDAWSCACEQHQGSSPACGGPEACGEPYCTAPGGGTGSPTACCRDGSDNDESSATDCDDPLCQRYAENCACQAWLLEATGASSPPAPPEGQACACAQCSSALEACLAGPDGDIETTDDPDPRWCLAAALCRSDTIGGGGVNLPWGCGRMRRDGELGIGAFSPNACPAGSGLQAAAQELNNARGGGDATASWLFESTSPGRMLARCLCNQRTGSCSGF